MTTSNDHPNARILREIYADLSTIDRYVDEDVVLHAAERDLPGTTPTYHGKQAVLDKELALVQATNDTLVMDVDHINANDHFATVTGHLRAHRDHVEIAMPFCGLWRFRNGRIIEHWEHAYDTSAFAAYLTGHTAPASRWLTDTEL